MAITWCGLAPHPPIIVAAVGGSRCSEVQTTIDSMRAWAKDLLAANPDRVVLISPHTPRPRNGIALWQDSQLQGDFAQFGAPQASCTFPNDLEWLTSFSRNITTDLYTLENRSLDHGAMVPLYFLQEAGWSGATVVLGLPAYEDASQLEAIGLAINQASQSAATALIASGDMSHCLKPGAPSGYDPKGAVFDQQFVAFVRQAQYQDVLKLSPKLQDEACQDVVGSCHVAWVATHFEQQNHHFYSYEAPFGVGYTVMKFAEVNP